MWIELRHLRAIRAIDRAGGLARAAERLNLTQSALSHQVKAIEVAAGIEIFVRRARPLRLSAAGQRLLRLADRILPEVEQAEEEFRSIRGGAAGRLHLAIECHACYEWLFPVLERFRRDWPEVDVDIRAGVAFDALTALAREDVDLVLSSDPEDLPGIRFTPLFEYSPVFVAPARHPLATRPFVEAEDFRDEVLIAYPVDRSKLDVFRALLMPKGVEPRAVRRVELTAMILLLVASGRGVAVLPDWVVRDSVLPPDLVTRPITAGGIRRAMFAATRSTDTAKPYVARWIELARDGRSSTKGPDPAAGPLRPEPPRAD